MNATILHDEHGRILAVSRIGDLKKAGSKFTKVAMVPGPGQQMLEVELNAEIEKRTLTELHRDYHVDLRDRKLVRKVE